MGERDDGLGLSLSLGNSQQKEPSLRLNLMPLTTSSSSSSFQHMHNQNNNSHPQKIHHNSWTHLFQSSGNTSLLFFSLFFFKTLNVLKLCLCAKYSKISLYFHISDPLLLIKIFKF